MKKNKIAVIGTVGLPANYGGFETLTEHLAQHLSQDWDMTVYCSGKKYPQQQRMKHYKGARLKYLPFNANGIQSILYDSISILHALLYADVLLVLGVSGGFLLPFVKWFTRVKIVISIDGIEWKRNKWGKAARLYLWMAEWLAVKYSHADISDNEAIQDYTAMRYKSLSNIIEYGADHTLKVAPSPGDKKKYTFLNHPYAFKVCRIEPENNIEMVLEAFARLPKYMLVLVGNWNNSEFGRSLRNKYAIYKHIVMLDPIYDQRELDLLRGNCFVYVHGHSAGGTNPSLVEAMALQLPVIAYGVSYNRATTEGKALYFKNSTELTGIIEYTRISDFKNLAASMKEIADRRYNWKLIAEKYAWLMTQVLVRQTKKYLDSSIGTIFSASKLIDFELAHLKTTSRFFEKR